MTDRSDESSRYDTEGSKSAPDDASIIKGIGYRHHLLAHEAFWGESRPTT
jgi:hypothetical protein